MQSEHRVSVIIPTYYRNERLRGAVQSVLHQGYEPIEILVVDDSGENHARPVGEEFEAVTYIPMGENRGPMGARVAGVDRATGEYVQFLDDDDRLYPNKLQRQIPLLANNDGVGVVYCGLQWAGGPAVRPRPTAKGDVLVDALRFDTSPCMMGTMLIERQVLANIDLMRHDHAADDIGLKIDLARATSFDYVDEVLVRRGNPEESVGTSLPAVEGRFEVIETFEDLYEEFPDTVRREALAETYLVQGQILLQKRPWSLAAIRSFALAAYRVPGAPPIYLVSLFSALLGRFAYDVSRSVYSRVVRGLDRRGKRM